MKKQTIKFFSIKNQGLLLIFVLSMVLLQSSFAAVKNISLFNVVGYGTFKPASQPGQTVRAVPNTYNTNNMPSLNVSGGDAQFLHIVIPPGVVSASVGAIDVFGAGWTDIWSDVFAAAGPNQGAAIPAGFEYSFFKSKPTGSLYQGSAIQPGAAQATSGAIAIKNERGATFSYSKIEIIYTLGSTQQDLENYNAFVKANGGTSGTVDTSTGGSSGGTTGGTSGGTTGSTSGGTTTLPPSSNCGLLDILAGSCSTNSGSTQNDSDPSPAPDAWDESDIGEDTTSAELQANLSSKGAVLEFLLRGALRKVELLSALDEIAFDNEGVSLVFGTTIFRFQPDWAQIPSSADMVENDSADFATHKVVGIASHQYVDLTFVNSDSGNTNTITLYPVINDKEKLRKELEAVNAVFKVFFDDNGWMVVVFNDGASVSVHFDNLQKKINSLKSSTAISYELPTAHGYKHNDVNGDGITDIVISYPDGTEQLVYIK